MSSQRWRHVEELYHAALEQPPAERSVFLHQACGDDSELMREVESLLGLNGRGDAFLEAPAAARAASGVPRLIPEWALPVGAMVGHYRVEMPVAIGGMGEVYRAHDTRLGRDIVLKTLPTGLANDPGYMTRFRGEALVLASLNHPNVATIHGLEESGGVCALVMELVDGETLAQRLARGPIPWREALPLALQAAEGVEAAHHKGIIHRDLKPGNLMVNSAGRVKVLDFGLARRTLESGDSPTTRTAPGTLLGTAAYMAPEQAEGREADARSDIFAFGAVLHEMLTARPVFRGDSTAALLSSILRDDPEPLPPGVPKELSRVITRCLDKLPTRRYQSMTDVKFALEDAREDQQRTPAPILKRRSRWPAAALALAALSAAGWYWAARRVGQEAPPVIVTPLADGDAPALSPDGKMVAFAWEGEELDNSEIYVKVLGTNLPLRLTRNPVADVNPVWSPDGRQIAFSRLYEMDRMGGAAVYIVPVLGGPERSLGLGVVQDWSPDGASLLVLTTGDGNRRGFYLVSTGDGSLQRLTTTRPGERPLAARFAPDGREVYFVLGETPGRSRMFRLPLDGRTPQAISIDGVRGIQTFTVMPGGQEFLLTGVPNQSILSGLWRVSVAGGVARQMPFGRDASGVTASRNNTFAYAQSQSNTIVHRVGAWPGTDREPRPWIISERRNSTPTLSPDGSRMAISSTRSGASQIWVSAADGTGPSMLTQFNQGAPGVVGSPAWSPDGEQLAFDVRTSNADIWVVSAKGGVPRQLTFDASDEMIPAWSPDGRWIYFTSNQSGNQTLWRVPSVGGKSEQFTPNGGYSAKLSPDGKYLYYLKSSREGELWRVSLGSGRQELVLREYQGRNFWVMQDGIYLLDRGKADELSYRRGVARFFRFRTGRVEELGFETRKPVSPYGICLSRDGKWLFYSQHENTSSTVLLVENFR